ncbi:MAG: hypothetical protein IPJ38_23185 [Dechloromonas sp.]|uniref:Uncharacterized protein n=1 Tax=Candidatus Dechloromonas phosphorivorans TaxID=2899244 RepID=A0A935K1S1_9RHOO|nr:hypothetical protein [Candidatus Dechloromonas phosphorivorans]
MVHWLVPERARPIVKQPKLTEKSPVFSSASGVGKLARQVNRRRTANNNVKRFALLASIENDLAGKKCPIMNKGIDNFQLALGQIAEELGIGELMANLIVS